MKSVLIVSTCYDVDSSYTASWARKLHDDLVKQKDTRCFLYDAQYLCRSSTALTDAVERADFVVFYGHGTKNSWVALPENNSATAAVAAIPLIDSTTVDLLKGRKVYAGCCWSLNGLGKDYLSRFPQGEYVGYDHEFGFEGTNADEFRQVIHQSVVDFVGGDPLTHVVSELKNDWADLRDRFFKGNLKRRPNAVAASQVADLNSQRIGSRP
jgi:hypothetical protein